MKFVSPEVALYLKYDKKLSKLNKKKCRTYSRHYENESFHAELDGFIKDQGIRA